MSKVETKSVVVADPCAPIWQQVLDLVGMEMRDFTMLRVTLKIEEPVIVESTEHVVNAGEVKEESKRYMLVEVVEPTFHNEVQQCSMKPKVVDANKVNRWKEPISATEDLGILNAVVSKDKEQETQVVVDTSITSQLHQVSIEYEVIERYEYLPSEPFGFVQLHYVPTIGQHIMLHWLNGKPAYKVKVLQINGSKLIVEKV